MDVLRQLLPLEVDRRARELALQEAFVLPDVEAAAWKPRLDVRSSELEPIELSRVLREPCKPSDAAELPERQEALLQRRVVLEPPRLQELAELLLLQALRRAALARLHDQLHHVCSAQLPPVDLASLA